MVVLASTFACGGVVVSPPPQPVSRTALAAAASHRREVILRMERMCVSSEIDVASGACP
ncbi:hypothetical protein LP420_30450 [Massilia sp. B-10]|nr:hypothetical protein LP420_30450 [Massilia sp. B-10]